ncbi:MAG: adenylate/guanylate cyclase domain-containing protein [Spirochaetota bacterium]
MIDAGLRSVYDQGVNIRGKIILVVLPLIVTPLLFAGLIATLLARNGITGVATQFLQFKTEQIVTYANGQWSLLEENALAERAEFREAVVDAIASFAGGVIRTDTELILAVDVDDELGFLVGRSEARGSEGADTAGALDVSSLGSEPQPGWTRFSLGGIARVGYAARFEPLSWTIYVTERESTFYESTFAIIRQIGIVLGVSVAVALVLLIFFAGYLTRPLRKVVDAMTQIIETNDLSQRVDVLYKDETGRLAHTFNIMTDQLERAYDHIKSYAMRAATARLKEQKTRTMFQKYVPSDVIEQFFANPEKMLVGDNRVVSILFSDIRDFTSISEMMQPDQLVETLNRYFTVMVDAIMEHHGIVDKYIGDAIMALFGTPEKREDDARQSAYAALDMVEALKDFNRWQQQRGLPGFQIGVGLNYGVVTVGNIGTEKKLDYTVIGDMVNVASRLEGLTKRYRWPIVISESVRRKLDDDIERGDVYVRLFDSVQVKGRATGLRVYGLGRGLNQRDRDLWSIHNEGMERFYAREFAEAERLFLRVLERAPMDVPATLMRDRCSELGGQSLAENWDGVVALTDK